jgi:hypothetical protein
MSVFIKMPAQKFQSIPSSHLCKEGDDTETDKDVIRFYPESV